MEMVYFTVVAIILYVVSDWILNQIERKRGERLEHRSVIFFFIIIILSVTTFSIIQSLYEKKTETLKNDAPELVQPDSTDGLK